MTLQHKLEEMMYKRNKLEIQELMWRRNDLDVQELMSGKTKEEEESSRATNFNLPPSVGWPLIRYFGVYIKDTYLGVARVLKDYQGIA